MDEFTEIAALLTKPEPSREAVNEGRHRLQNTMLNPASVRRRPTGRLASYLGLAIVAPAAAVAIAISSTGTSPAHSPNSPPEAPATARQILMVAASTAEKLPDKGRYWHIRLEERQGPGAAPEVSERWIERDGRVSFKGKKSGGELTRLGDQRWGLGALEVSLPQLQRLPDRPDLLKAWLTDKVAHAGIRTSAGPLTAEQQKREVFQGLVSLISLVPTTSATRAAAFRAIASYPDVKSVGTVDGGQGLEFPSESGGKGKLVVDPATSQIREANILVWLDGAEWMTSGSYTPTAGWTDAPPR
ncbi:hypothetical protein [Actinomadura roseirufa]|uniref:hypothetical protein n=1 Tax=Actinomadura roseirufa TaxID=2094049 RepID=UPI0010411829|nr:hypothetical protein [Actinomadura roseirufa]